MDLVYDEPITSKSEDLYNRTALAARCAEVLETINSDRAFVIGLSGQWGLGKTSFLNLVKEQLEKRASKTPIVEFNPWLYSSHEQLIREFFNQLETSLDLAKESELAKALSQYSEAIAGAGVTVLSLVVPQVADLNEALPFANAFEAFAIKRVLKKIAASKGANEKTLVQLKEDISHELAKRKENIVIFVDDVDRLDSEEVCLLFKLVNAVASFPRMTFLLSYDVEVVAKALSRVQDADGMTYLEKIVQLPIALPPVSRSSVRGQLSKKLDSYIATQQTFVVDESERSRLLQVFEKLVLNRITTPRQLRRYLNQFEVVALTAGGEICPADIIGLAGLTLFCPATMRWLVEHREDVCSGGSLSFGFGDSYYTGLDESLYGAIADDASDVDEVKEALRLLFPKTGHFTDTHRSVQPAISRETGRVAHLENFQHYLGSSVNYGASRAILQRLMSAADVKELSEKLIELDESNQLDRFSEFVQAEKRGLDNRRCEVICTAVLRSIGSFNQADEEGLFNWSSIHRVSVLLADLFRILGVDRADVIMTDSLTCFTTQDLIGLGFFLRDERLAQYESQNVACLSRHVFEQLAARYVDVVVDNWQDVLRMSHLQSKFLWKALDEDLGGNALAEVRRRYDNNVEMRVLCMAAVLSHWVSGSGDGYAIKIDGDGTYEFVLSAPTPAEVRGYGGTEAFVKLPDDVKTRVAALYILLRADDIGKVGYSGNRATSDAAWAVVEEWLGQ